MARALPKPCYAASTKHVPEPFFEPPLQRAFEPSEASSSNSQAGMQEHLVSAHAFGRRSCCRCAVVVQVECQIGWKKNCSSSY